MSEATTIDDYELLNCLATGSATQIWEVKQKSSGQTYAMKLMLPEAFADSEQRKALKNEAALGKSFDHPNLITIFDVVVGKKHAYFIMEYFRSANLKQMLRNERAAVQARARKIMEAVSSALAHMHEKNWVHKDIKPDNILVTKGSEVRVIDFSLTGRPAGALTRLMGGSKSQVIQGTRTYLAPEVIRRKPLTFAADMYSLGITFYEMLCGRPPFIQGNPNELLMAHVRDTPERPSGYNPNVAPEADALVMKMLSKKPEQRPATMMDLQAELRSVKLFKQDPEEFAKDEATKAATNFSESVDSRLDSRADAARDRSAASPPPAPKPKPKPVIAEKPAPPKPAAPVAQQPPPQGYLPPGYVPQGYPPGYAPPPMGYPGYPPPPGQPPAGWPQGYPPQGMPPGYPGMPGYPPAGGYPQGGAGMPMPPGQPGAPPAPPPPGGVPPASVQPAPPQSQPSAPKPPAPQEDVEEDIPLMTDLPDVL
ncbi:MAG: serine/threonine-protein kinase [Planctomycetaceae bacterium]